MPKLKQTVPSEILGELDVSSAVGAEECPPESYCPSSIQSICQDSSQASQARTSVQSILRDSSQVSQIGTSVQSAPSLGFQQEEYSVAAPQKPYSSSDPHNQVNCQVSSSSGVWRPPRRHSKDRNGWGEWNEEGSNLGGTNNFVDSSDTDLTMRHGTNDRYQSQESTHRRVASPHSEGAQRKSNKPQMERRRRQRINESVNELRKCIVGVFKLDPSRYDKLEKADILELTVRYIRFIQSKYDAVEKCSTSILERKPIHLDAIKSVPDSITGNGCQDNGLLEKFPNSLSEQPLTLVIQTFAPNIQVQGGLQEPLSTAVNTGNSVGAQPTHVPVIHLNISNNICNPQQDVAQIPNYLQCTNGYVNPGFADPTTKCYHHSGYSPSFTECPSTYSKHPRPFDSCLNQQYVFPEPVQLFTQPLCAQAREYQEVLTNKKILSTSRPIAPKPPIDRQDVLREKSPSPMNFEVQDQQEEVWRPWDANRKILKPHLVR